MQPSYSSIGQIFSAQTRYTVPLFQRPYVWNKEEQWQPLWDDIRALAERVLNPPLHKPVAGHFLGTVVLEQLKTTAIAMPQRQVIDGQQRLTTLQLLLKAAEHALTFAGADAPDEAKKGIELAAVRPHSWPAINMRTTRKKPTKSGRRTTTGRHSPPSWIAMS